ncbi:MAG: hypothetical protein P0Y55_12125 [Candidatus Cohnella colombiensis]|uniref:Uncharacterized protein n=1 Tax=Candidatus Cohnella colombiensis TaxID=3121368 RepID=A0AA95JAV3_9BACL|nr:MAG: hypothetical protein P0Y55_12125 [Cohnella sp.]
MKAYINGVKVEGTVDEVWAFLQLSNAQETNLKPIQPMPHWVRDIMTDNQLRWQPEITC